MKIVVCDDEDLARERLARTLRHLGHNVVAKVSSGVEAINAFKEHQPEVMFLDIRMPQMDGVTCATELSKLEHPPAIIFVTAYDQYAIDAFKAHAIGYLLKPAKKKELIEALDTASKLNVAQLKEISKLKQPESQPKRLNITARTHRGVELIALSDIYFFSADQKYVKVRHQGGMVLIDQTLKELEKEFADRLFRIHRNALINLDYLERLEAIDTGHYQVCFKDIDDTLAVSRRHVPILRSKIQSL